MYIHAEMSCKSKSPFSALYTKVKDHLARNALYALDLWWAEWVLRLATQVVRSIPLGELSRSRPENPARPLVCRLLAALVIGEEEAAIVLEDFVVLHLLPLGVQVAAGFVGDDWGGQRDALVGDDTADFLVILTRCQVG